VVVLVDEDRGVHQCRVRDSDEHSHGAAGVVEVDSSRSARPLSTKSSWCLWHAIADECQPRPGRYVLRRRKSSAYGTQIARQRLGQPSWSILCLLCLVNLRWALPGSNECQLGCKPVRGRCRTSSVICGNCFSGLYSLGSGVLVVVDRQRPFLGILRTGCGLTKIDFRSGRHQLVGTVVLRVDPDEEVAAATNDSASDLELCARCCCAASSGAWRENR
jgi:hypothetical protein